MSLAPIFVRGRDGSWYRDPLLVFTEGFLCFDDEEPPELVLWLREDGADVEPMPVIRRVLGENHGVHRVGPRKPAERVVPGSSPPVFQPAVGFDLDLRRRIPVPTMHEGSFPRLTRNAPPEFYAIDLPSHPRDPHELRIPT